MNVSKFRFKQDLIKVDRLPGFYAGVGGELMFPGVGFGVDFGLHYAMTGSKLYLGQREVWASDGYGTENCYLHSLQIPINLRFKYTNLNGIERKIAPFVFAGPIFNIHLASSKLDCMEYPTGSVQIQCGIGAEIFEHYQVSAGYYWGTTYEMRTVKLDNFSAKPQGWLVNLSYYF